MCVCLFIYLSICLSIYPILPYLILPYLILSIYLCVCAYIHTNPNYVGHFRMVSLKYQLYQRLLTVICINLQQIKHQETHY